MQSCVYSDWFRELEVYDNTREDQAKCGKIHKLMTRFSKALWDVLPLFLSNYEYRIVSKNYFSIHVSRVK